MTVVICEVYKNNMEHLNWDESTTINTNHYFEDWTFVKLFKLFLTFLKLAKICANGVTIKSSTCARSVGTVVDAVSASFACL
jgi:hypothetical protein